MKQTLLAFLAMSIFSLLALSQQRVIMRYHGMIYGRDYELAAMNVVSEKLAEIQTKAFDEADIGKSDPGQRSVTDDLSARFGLDENEDGIAAADDIDDYHGYSIKNDTYIFNGYPYSFEWSVEVCYVSELNYDKGTCTSGKTLAKQVTISLKEYIDDRNGSGTLGRPPVEVKINRVFSPAGLAFH